MSGEPVLAVRVCMALVLLVSVIAKTRRRSAFAEFREWVRSLGVVPAELSAATAVVMVAAEAATLVLVLMPFTAAAGLASAAALMWVFAAAIGLIVRRGGAVSCRCFGASTRPMGTLEIARNAVLGLLAAGAAVAALLAPAPGLSAPGTSVSGAVIALAAGSALAAVTMRLDALAAAVAARRQRRADLRRPPDDMRADAGGGVGEDEDGLPVPGTEIGAFTTTTTAGEPISRADLSGGTLVGFFTMGCGPCKRLTPQFIDFAAGFPGGRRQVLAVIVAARQEAPAEQARHLDPVARVVVERPGGPVAGAFGVTAFPFVCVLGDHVVMAVEEAIGPPVV